MKVQRIGVVVPAHNEQDTVVACLTALAQAIERVEVPVRIALVLDAGTDQTGPRAVDIAQQLDLSLDLVSIDARSVGRARAAGVDHLLGSVGLEGTWVATTDADSLVPPAWLARHIELVAEGAELVAGTVVVRDWAQHSIALRQHVTRAYAIRVDETHGHIHGANLAFTAQTYRAVGGFGAMTGHEDVHFVEAVRELGRPIAWPEDIAVATSSRRVGRAPIGFAHYLRRAERLITPRPAGPR